ncbi:autotransporter assembly complex protein TamA [Biformimicrobium ophioploci]|uniref:Autotransporter assembly complex family protein n=1 Tax=Biformimicrobium ophioploci TaxID=3036711 RepID=A0ABQ6LXW4_9GAMM|nr:BamA/TamA family outer membrane protein [Microbulbifer sp. NKW57]GMG86942.1 autotransporter assembly complex family protein [Microbulbifer sp. NKW57]
MTTIRFLLATALLLGCFSQAQALPFFENLPDYKVRMQGDFEDPELRGWLRDELQALRKNDPVIKEFESLDKVARYERGRLNELLRSVGYYRAQVRYRITEEVIHYLVRPGPVYIIESVNVDLPPMNMAEPLPDLPLAAGTALVASRVLEGREIIARHVGQHACLLDLEVAYDVKVIHNIAQARVVYRVSPSAQVNFGEIYFSGLESIQEDYLRGLVGIKPGDCFSPQALDSARLRLLKTNLIAGVTPEISEPYDGRVDIYLHVQERKHRTFRAGVGYTSSEGFGGALGWEHRNFFQRGERVDISTKVNKVQQSLEGALTVPRFLRTDQQLRGALEIKAEELDAYEADSVSLSALVTRRLSKHRKVSLGGELKYSDILDEGVRDSFTLFALPVAGTWNTTDNILDAKRGVSLGLEFKPFIDLNSSSTQFNKTTFSAAAFHTFEGTGYTPTIAARFVGGVITGLANERIPADERFYAGGGGSVRGYSYQSLGPRLDGASTGGRGLTEISLETRFRVNEDWGGVVFVDGGNAFESSAVKFDNLFWGAGIGVRYFTSFAPLRFDIAFPLDRRDGTDDPYQIYVSFGQAF